MANFSFLLIFFSAFGVTNYNPIELIEYPDRRVKITLLSLKCIDTHDKGAGNDEDRLYFKINEPEVKVYPNGNVFKFEPGEVFTSGNYIDGLLYSGVIWQGVINDTESYDIDLRLINSFDGSKKERESISMGYIPLTLQNNFGYVLVDWKEYPSGREKTFTDKRPDKRKVFGTSVIIDRPVKYPGKEVIVEYKLKYEYWSVMDEDEDRDDWIKNEKQNDSEYILKVKIEID